MHDGDVRLLLYPSGLICFPIVSCMLLFGVCLCLDTIPVIISDNLSSPTNLCCNCMFLVISRYLVSSSCGTLIVVCLPFLLFAHSCLLLVFPLSNVASALLIPCQRIHFTCFVCGCTCQMLGCKGVQV